MDQLKVLRTTLQGRLNRMATVIDALVQAEVTLDQLNSELDSLNELWADYRNLNEQFIAKCTELKDIEDFLDFEGEFRMKFNAAKSKVNELVRVTLCKNPPKSENGESGDGDSNGGGDGDSNGGGDGDGGDPEIRPLPPAQLVSPELQLPKGILPSYDGDYGEWTSFFDLFTSAVHNNPRLTDAQRLLYLKSYTTGRAANLLRHIKVEDGAYAGALEVLKNKFDRKDQIVTHHIQRFVEIPSITGNAATSLRRIHDTADDVRRALQALHREDRDCWLIHLLLVKVDPETRQLWVNKTTTSTEAFSLSTFLEFLEIRAYSLETAQSTTRHHSSTPKPVFKSTQQRSHSYVTTNNTSEEKCELCNEKRHFLYFCRRFKELPVEERKKHVLKVGLCNNCLRSPHSDGICNAGQCKRCNSNAHHTLLHSDAVNSRANLSFGAVSHVSCSSFSSVFLATAVIDVIDITGKALKARALLDSASQASFITTRLAKNLGIKQERVNLPVTGISGTSTRITTVLNVTIRSRHSKYQRHLECAVLPTISGQLPSQRFDVSSWKIEPGMALADAFFNVPAEIDILIGASAFYHLLENQQIVLGPTMPILQKTKLGWVVAGPLSNEREQAPTNCFITTIQDIKESETLKDLVAKFWEIEDLPATKILSVEEQQCEQHYKQHTTRDPTGRYIVKLPFKKDPSVIGVTGYAALHQFNTLQRRLQRDPEVQQLYHDYINGFLEAGHITKLSPPLHQEPVIFLPHHGVLKDSTTTKLRVVFNASMKSSNGTSLNDLLMTGPVVQKSLYDLLLGFRLHNVAITGDIEKMYLQVKVTEQDRNLVRMLWQEPKEPMHEYTMNTVTFGMACAPYLATRTLQQLSEDDGHLFPEGRSAMEDFYVDDLLSGATTVEEAKIKLHQLTALLKRGGFSIRKWASNNPAVLEDVPAEDRAIDHSHQWDAESSLKTLGIQWQFREDLFTFSISCDPQQEHFTKAQVLSTTARIFDPLGFLGPVIVIAKLFMQELWRIEIDWNEPLPTHLAQRWRMYLKHLQELWKIRIPRRLIGVDQPKRIMLHGYCDASVNIYGAVVYIKAMDENNNKSSRIGCSKSRIAPIHRPTINRLELCSCELLAELLIKVKTALSGQIIIHEVKAFSDSKVALAYIAGDPSRWKPFVANRVVRINELLPAIHWGYISTKRNPADILSRGAAPAVLALLVDWWEGIDDDDQEVDGELTRQELQNIEKEQRKFVPIQTFFSEVSESLEFILQKFSSYIRMVRVTAWIHRFVRNCQVERVHHDTGPLLPVELDAANRMLIQYSQYHAYGAEVAALKSAAPLHSKSKLIPLCPFLESDLLRVGGRLARSNLPYEAKHPWILPYGSPLAIAIFRHTHLSNHHLGPQALLATVRQRFWVPSGRQQARQVVWNCIPCRRANSNPKLLEQIMGQLPPERTQPAPPFYNSGVDYGGPITIVQRRGPGAPTMKGYIALFVCFATRAVHIEAVTKLSTKAFLAALSRFQSRRGVVGHIYSDRGTNFVGASREMRLFNRLINSTDHNNEVADKLSQKGTQWHFNAPGTPHMGGLWEAAIKSAKTHLNKVTQNARLTYEEFATLLAEVEAILNSRPISPASSDPNDLQPLTPGHFLIGRPLNATNQLHQWPTKDEPYDVRFKYIQELQQHFWDRWSREYVPELQRRGKWRNATNPLEVGDLVLLKRSQSPLQMWQLGRIRKIHEAPDGHPRLVTVYTGNTEIVQSVNNLSKLPMGNE